VTAWRSAASVKADPIVTSCEPVAWRLLGGITRSPSDNVGWIEEIFPSVDDLTT